MVAMQKTIQEEKYAKNYIKVLSDVGENCNRFVIDNNFGGKVASDYVHDIDIADIRTYVTDEAYRMLNFLAIKSPETYYHSLNVAHICSDLAGWSELCDPSLAFTAGLLHDFGKLKIPNPILNKPKELTTEEYEVMKNHAKFGYDVLVDCGRTDPYISKTIRLCCYQHHERYDGSGYPCGLIGQDLEPLSRAVAIADVWDALTSRRVYRDRISVERAAEILRDQACRFDPELLSCFLGHVGEKTE